jgi:hypothetical protein
VRTHILSGLGIGFAPELLIGDDLNAALWSSPCPPGAARRGPSTRSRPRIAEIPPKRALSSNTCERSCADNRYGS